LGKEGAFYRRQRELRKKVSRSEGKDEKTRQEGEKKESNKNTKKKVLRSCT